MSNNPLLPPPDMDDFEATMIREQNPLAERPKPQVDPGVTDPFRPAENRARPRRAKRRNPIWTYIAIGGWFAVASFTGAFLGTLLANLI